MRSRRGTTREEKDNEEEAEDKHEDEKVMNDVRYRAL